MKTDQASSLKCMVMVFFCVWCAAACEKKQADVAQPKGDVADEQAKVAEATPADDAKQPAGEAKQPAAPAQEQEQEQAQAQALHADGVSGDYLITKKITLNGAQQDVSDCMRLKLVPERGLEFFIQIRHDDDERCQMTGVAQRDPKDAKRWVYREIEDEDIAGCVLVLTQDATQWRIEDVGQVCRAYTCHSNVDLDGSPFAVSSRVASSPACERLPPRAGDEQEEEGAYE